MNYFIKLAYKNLSRHKLRTTVSIIAIAFAVIIVIFARGFINGMVNNFYADTIQYNSGHVKIIDKDYQMEGRVLSLTETVQGDDDSNLNDIINELEEIQHVRTVAPRIKFGAITTTEGELINMIGWGVNPDKELAATDINKLITEGRMVEFGNMEIVMGSKLLDKLNKEVGDKVTLVFNNSFNSLNGATFRIVGEVTSGLTMLNEIIFYLSLDQAQRLLLMEDSSTELLIFADDRNNTEEGGLVGWLEMAKAIYNFIYVFIVALASIVIINTMIMIVNERTKEIGMMHALGLEQRDILYLFLIEGAIMGAVGSLIGAILGGFLTNLLSGIGINFGSMTEGFSSELLFSSTIYPQFSYGNMFFGFILGTIIVTITCVIPARRAANLEPTDALREF